MSKFLHIDFETRSELELGGKNSVGIHNYAIHPSTKALMMAYAFGDEEPEVWFPDEGPIPDRVLKHFSSGGPVAAWNSNFERYILNYVCNIFVPIAQFQDPQASARYLSLPATLSEVGLILNLPEELQKDDAGEDLIKLFSYPHYTRKTKTQEKKLYWHSNLSMPEQWASFVNYCKQDVRAEREIARRLSRVKVFPLPERERKIWIFDQRVNDRGVAVDLQFVEHGYELALREREELIAQNDKLTGLENSNSPTQLMGWVKGQGYGVNTLRKEAVQAELDFNEKLTPLAREVLDIRKQASSTTYTKMAAILRQISPDKRLRNQFLYMGSSRCGRWTGNAVQLHNMARPNKVFEDLDNVDEFRKLVKEKDYEGIKTRFGSILLAVKNCVRTSFLPSKGNRLRIADLSAIETRVAAWIAQCPALLEIFTTFVCPAHPETEYKETCPCPHIKEDGTKCGRSCETKDPYIAFATMLTGKSYSEIALMLVSKDPMIKAEGKKIRQDAKPAMLGCVYRLGGGAIKPHPKTGDLTKTGMFGYAAGMGIHAPMEKWHADVKTFRTAYPEVVKLWYDCERAVAKVLKGESQTSSIGPNGCFVVDKIDIVDRNPILRIKLPSGRYLHYVDACMKNTKMPWEDGNGEEVWRETFCYSGQDQTTKQWVQITSHGGKITENIVQATARDVLAESLLRFENELDLPIVMHVHDEAVADNEDDAFSNDFELMVKVMSEPVKWAPGLPLGANGFNADYYHK